MKIIYGLILGLACQIGYAQEGPFYYPTDPNETQPPQQVQPQVPQPRQEIRPCVPYVPLVPNFYRHGVIGPDGYIYYRWSWYWGL